MKNKRMSIWRILARGFRGFALQFFLSSQLHRLPSLSSSILFWIYFFPFTSYFLFFTFKHKNIKTKN